MENKTKINTHTSDIYGLCNAPSVNL